MKKTVLITGASSGIGKAAAILLINKGFTVYGTSRRKAKMFELEELGIRPLQMDLTIPESIKEGIKEIYKEQNSIDILVNNAGYGSYGALEDVPITEAKKQFEVNLFGLAQLTKLDGRTFISLEF